MTERFLVIAGGSIYVLLGGAHLYFTFFSNKFLARKPEVTEAMKNTSPILTRDTTMWDAWIGFNASHSLGAIFFGAFYILLAALHPGVLEQSKIFITLAVLISFSYLALAKRYWFKIPLTGILIVTALFSASAILIFV